MCRDVERKNNRNKNFFFMDFPPFQYERLVVSLVNWGWEHTKLSVEEDERDDDDNNNIEDDDDCWWWRIVMFIDNWRQHEKESPEI